jgi:hypothetical protein
MGLPRGYVWSVGVVAGRLARTSVSCSAAVRRSAAMRRLQDAGEACVRAAES